MPTLANQLNADGLTWKGYEEDMGNIPTRESATCGHPTVGGSDGTSTAVAGDGYASRHDPFVYFHSIIDTPTVQHECGPARRLPAGACRRVLPQARPAW